jgi:hypothetical protein
LEIYSETYSISFLDLSSLFSKADLNTKLSVSLPGFKITIIRLSQHERYPESAELGHKIAIPCHLTYEFMRDLFLS